MVTEESKDWVERQLELLTPHEGVVSLDQIGEVIGAQAVTQLQIEQLFDALEERGVRIEQEGTAVSELLRQVLSAARTLKGEGQALRPSVISERSGLSVREVRVALLFADVLRR